MLRRLLFWTCLCFGWFTSHGCGGDPVNPLREEDENGLETSRLPFVEDFEPTSGTPGSRIALEVRGENFDAGSRVDLLLSGSVVDEVHTLSTVFVTPEELVADISIAPDAPLGSYQVQVTTSGGKRGIPIEDFVVLADSTDAVQLEFENDPGTALVGFSFPTPIVVTARTSDGRIETRFAGTVFLSLLAHPSGASLSGSTAAKAVRGVATFLGDTRIDEAATGYRLVATATGLNPDTSAAFEVHNSRIAFVSDRDGTPKIYVMNADGSGVTRLTDGGDADSRPAWSPDGRRIAFARGRDQRLGWSDVDNGTCGIYVMNADGSDLTRLTTSCGDETPAWSPDGTRIAFTKWIPDGVENDGIYVVNADGSGVARLTEAPEEGMDGYPTWSPDGQRIAFNRASDLDGELPHLLYVMNADGSEIHRLTLDENPWFAEGCPAWSPDGSKIVFWSFGYGIATVDSHGGFPSTIYGGSGFSGNVHFFSCPTWSPDGRNIVFARERNSSTFHERRLVIANASGQGPVQPLPRDLSTGDDYEPAWSRVSP